MGVKGSWLCYVLHINEWARYRTTMDNTNSPSKEYRHLSCGLDENPHHHVRDFHYWPRELYQTDVDVSVNRNSARCANACSPYAIHAHHACSELNTLFINEIKNPLPISVNIVCVLFCVILCCRPMNVRAMNTHSLALSPCRAQIHYILIWRACN